MRITGYVSTIEEARDRAASYGPIRSESVELQGSSKPGNLWVAYVAILSGGDEYRGDFGTEPIPASRIGALTRGLADPML